MLTVERRTVRTRVIVRAQELLDRYGAGVRVTAVSLEGMGPPEGVADAFRDVNNARWDRDRAINDAEAYLRRVLPQARGEARRILLEADGYYDQTVQQDVGLTDSLPPAFPASKFPSSPRLSVYLMCTKKKSYSSQC